jgi:pSer/pThr/pTyr-binding forkhead associated (FHA) protein
MILCPNCHHQEVSGAIFCSECGAQLVTSDRVMTQSIRRNPSDILASVQDTPPPLTQPEKPKTEQVMVSIYLVDTGQIMHLSDRSEYTIGRIAEGQPILPDVDLSVYEAYTLGVSRLHACLKIINQRVVITDLGSSNGTRVNGQKIMPHIDFPLSHGDMVALGKLKTQILIRR